MKENSSYLDQERTLLLDGIMGDLVAVGAYVKAGEKLGLKFSAMWRDGNNHLAIASEMERRREAQGSARVGLVNEILAAPPVAAKRYRPPYHNALTAPPVDELGSKPQG